MENEDFFEDPAFKESVRRNIEGLSGSSVFTAIFSKNYEKDIQAIMQFGLAVLMNKPILLIAPREMESQICDNVKRLAQGIEFVDDWNNGLQITAAAKRLMDKAKKMGFM
jgi:hypothetical protein